jgi:hypothetical protein
MSNLAVEVRGELWEGWTLQSPKFIVIEKEPQTQGHVYIITRPGSVKDVAWVSQSIPVLVAAIKKFTHINVNTAAFYRILRGESAGVLHKDFTVYKAVQREVASINQHCHDATRTLVFTRSPDKWRLKIEKESID